MVIARGKRACDQGHVENQSRAAASRPPTPVARESWLRSRFQRALWSTPRFTPAAQILIGLAAAAVAVAIRSVLPLDPQQLPTITVVVALAIVTAFAGARAGIACALAGGLTCWYLFFNPSSWSLANHAWIPLMGFAIIACVIIMTAHLYRASERMHRQRELGALEAQAAHAELFAAELAHRLKNALTIVQSIAVQTMDPKSADTVKFVGRLRALANANDLLSEHVSAPAAAVREVIDQAIGPFRDHEGRFRIEGGNAKISAQQVISLALALHELATNAVKYGSLSGPEGRVAIRVDERADRVEIGWEEHGGPLVTEPARSGFGTRLLLRAGVDTKLDYAPEGLRCTIGIRKT